MGARSTARSGSPTSPAPPSSRSRSPARCRRTSCAPTRASRSARRSRSPTASSRRRTGRAGSSPCRTSSRAPRTSARCAIGQRLGETALRPLGAPVRLRPADRAAAARRVAGHRAEGRRTTPAPRSGTCRSARASPSRRCRWSRAYAAIANGGEFVKPRLTMDEEPRAGPARDVRAHGGARAAHAGGRARADRHRARGGRRRATTSRARPERPRSPRTASTPRTSTSPRSSASRPPTNPQLLAAVIVDEPKVIHSGGEVAAPAFEKIASFALPYLGIPPGLGPRWPDRRAACLEFRCPMTLRELLDAAGIAAPPRSAARRCRRSRAWPTGARASRRGRSFFACRDSWWTGTSSPPTRSSAGRPRSCASARSALDVPEVVVPSVRAAMGPLAAAFHGKPDGALRVVGVTGHERQDDDRLPRAPRARGAGHPDGPARDGALGDRRPGGGGGAHDARGRRPAGDASAACSTRATRRA